MKKLTLSILTIILLFSTSYGQVNRKDAENKILRFDTTMVVLTDTTKFISIQDLLKFSDPYKDKYSARAWESFQAIFNATISDAIKEWNDKHKRKP